MKAICAVSAVVVLTVFTAVNLFIPYALLVLATGAVAAYAFGIPCGILSGKKGGSCRLGTC
ncbi:MAG: hypothetical protein WHT06_02065 [Desulfobacterales bacterium]